MGRGLVKTWALRVTEVLAPEAVRLKVVNLFQRPNDWSLTSKLMASSKPKSPVMLKVKTGWLAAVVGVVVVGAAPGVLEPALPCLTSEVLVSPDEVVGLPLVVGAGAVGTGVAGSGAVKVAPAIPKLLVNPSSCSSKKSPPALTGKAA